MSSSPENFDSLEKLLRLKRHEQPPPRYFNEFSGRVIARIENGEARVSWWERFGFDLRPAFAAGVGIVACGLVVYGVATTESGDGLNGMAGQGVANGSSAIADGALAGSVAASSTNPVSNYGTPIDRNVFRAGPQVMPANFLRQ